MAVGTETVIRCIQTSGIHITGVDGTGNAVVAVLWRARVAATGHNVARVFGTVLSVVAIGAFGDKEAGGASFFSFAGIQCTGIAVVTVQSLRVVQAA